MARDPVGSGPRANHLLLKLPVRFFIAISVSLCLCGYFS
jgi:hypothetical protein